MKPTNDYEELVLAIALAINAPDDEKTQQCIVMAKRLAANPYTDHTLRYLCAALLSKLDVERAKKQASKEANNDG